MVSKPRLVLVLRKQASENSIPACAHDYFCKRSFGCNLVANGYSLHKPHKIPTLTKSHKRSSSLNNLASPQQSTCLEAIDTTKVISYLHQEQASSLEAVNFTWNASFMSRVLHLFSLTNSSSILCMVKNHKVSCANVSQEPRNKYFIACSHKLCLTTLQKYMELQASFMSYACLMSLVNI